MLRLLLAIDLGEHVLFRTHAEMLKVQVQSWEMMGAMSLVGGESRKWMSMLWENRDRLGSIGPVPPSPTPHRDTVPGG